MYEGDTVHYMFLHCCINTSLLRVEEVLRYYMNNHNVLLPSEVDVAKEEYASIAQYVVAPVSSPR